jgi:4-amino-4-deoxy-L-arabinose transferase-like glycosyltransferase
MAVPLLLAIMFAVALGARLNGITNPPLDFSADKEYRSAVIARSIYYDHFASVPSSQREVASAAAQQEAPLEPPIGESLAAVEYWASGGEHLWMPRVQEVLIWLLGGWFLFLLCARAISRRAAIVSLALYLFTPYTFAFSRSFQPDPTMVATIMLSLWLTARYHQGPSKRGLIAAASAAALAVFVKPMAVFMVVAVFMTMAIQARGLRRTAWSGVPFLFVALSVLPAAAWLLATGDSQSSGRFYPDLLTTLGFWRGWGIQVDAAVGLGPALLALAISVIVARGRAGALLAGMWVGYLAFAFSFTYWTMTHTYYAIQIVPVVAVAIGLGVDRLLGRLQEPRAKGVVYAVGATAVPVFVAVGLHTGAIDPLSAYNTAAADLGSHQIPVDETVGDLLHHSSQCVFVAPEYAKPLEYYGLLAGDRLPSQADDGSIVFTGGTVRDAASTIDAAVRAVNARWLVITDLAEWSTDDAYKAAVAQRFTLYRAGPGYLIYAVRTTSS